MWLYGFSVCDVSSISDCWFGGMCFVACGWCGCGFVVVWSFWVCILCCFLFNFAWIVLLFDNMCCNVC